MRVGNVHAWLYDQMIERNIMSQAEEIHKFVLHVKISPSYAKPH